jgi:diguanylate cyclase (GGDEF)-like protein
MSNPIRWLFSRWLLACTLLLAGGGSLAAPPALLPDDAPVVDAWPSVSILSDPSRTLSIEDVRARGDDFAAPTGAHANLGVRRDAVWLRIALAVPPGHDGRRVLEIDYPTLNRVDAWLFGGGRLVQRAALGNSLPFSRHLLPSRAHAVALALDSGREHELYVRIETKSSAVLPVWLVTPSAFHGREAARQVLQGLMTGVGLCLLLYTLAQWVTLRERMFLHYAVTIAGTTLFFFAQFGLAPQYLWPDNPWLAMNMAPLAILFAVTGLAPFIGRVLKVGEWSRAAARALHAMTLAAIVVAAAFVLGLIDYRVLQLATTILGPLPMLVALGAGWVRWREGDRAAPYILLGWTAYALGAGVLIALLRGWIGANFWSQHAFQFATMFEMLMWMMVLGVRIDEIREAAQRAHLERDALRSMAYTDALTGLPNRRGLNEALRQEMPKCGPERLVALYLLDLDGFKAVNDRLGHDAGDELLQRVAERLRALLRASDVVARLGGDEFVVMACGLPADADAQRLGRKLLDGFAVPFEVDGQRCDIGLTIGYALAPLDGRDAIGLLKRADAAMYAGKQAGRNCIRRGGASTSLAGA